MSDAACIHADPSPSPVREFGPDYLLVTMGPHRVVALKVPISSLTRHETASGDGFGVLALAMPNGMALYVEQDAATLRDLAAACLTCADRLDGGKGKQ